MGKITGWGTPNNAQTIEPDEDPSFRREPEDDFHEDSDCPAFPPYEDVEAVIIDPVDDRCENPDAPCALELNWNGAQSPSSEPLAHYPNHIKPVNMHQLNNRLAMNEMPEARRQYETNRICEAISKLNLSCYYSRGDYCDITTAARNAIEALISSSTAELDYFSIMEALQEIAQKQGRAAAVKGIDARSPNLNSLINHVSTLSMSR